MVVRGIRSANAALSCSFPGAAQIVVPWTGEASAKPKQADFKAWVDHIRVLSSQPASPVSAV